LRSSESAERRIRSGAFVVAVFLRKIKVLAAATFVTALEVISDG